MSLSIVINDRIVSSGAISIMEYVPNPYDPNSTIAFLHSIYTEKEFRHHHYASLITQRAISSCKQEGISRLYLFSSKDGRYVYEKIGFTPVDNLMMLFQK
jgi:N-acetylglutamate synthase-like GNAT family acetyltransferase